jgi:hypothetical protein
MLPIFKLSCKKRRGGGLNSANFISSAEKEIEKQTSQEIFNRCQAAIHPSPIHEISDHSFSHFQIILILSRPIQEVITFDEFGAERISQ